MKSASIAYRVADFLKQHPPFEYMEADDLLALVAGGRVNFHEELEYVYRQGEPRGPFLFVIQQGSVQLLAQSEKGEQLKDLLGSGDILGVGRFLGAETHLHSARTCSDVILYAIPAADFDRMVAKYPAVSHYVAAYSSVSDSEVANTRAVAGMGSALWLGESAPPLDLLRRRVLTAAPDLPLREAAQVMSRHQSSVLVIVDSERTPLGLVTDADIREHAAASETAAPSTLRDLMQPCPVAASGLTLNHYVMEMMRGRSPAVVVTEDGKPSSAVVGVVTEADVMVACGHHPHVIVRRISQTRDLGELTWLRERGEAMVASQLHDRSGLSAFAPMLSEINGALFEQLVRIAEDDAAAEGNVRVDLSSCWLFAGDAGRRELLTRRGLDHVLVYADPAPGAEAAARRYFSDIAHRIARGLHTCGFTAPPIAATDPRWCQPIKAWKRRYSEWVKDPIMNEIQSALVFFDALPVCGDADLARELRLHIGDEVKANPVFIPLLANDSLGNLPPLTFFRGLVVEEEGTQHESLDLVRCALRPIADVARVLALAAGHVDVTSTVDRLAEAAIARPEHATLFREAQEAFHIALYRRTRTALREDSDGSLINPSQLRKYDQQLLKSAFRSILALLEHAATHYLTAPRQ